jgi:NADP-dependent 3-hydroxy acid dehydrogenase YdfG
MTAHGPATADGPVAIVTGATGSIGSATARRLVAGGWQVAIVGRDRARLGTVAADLGPTAAAYVADATDSAAVDAAVAAAFERFGPPVGLVHAVGSTLLKPAHALSDVEIE